MLLVLPPPRPRVEVIHAFRTPYQGLMYPSLSEDEAAERKEELRSSASRELAKLLAAALARADVRPRGSALLEDRCPVRLASDRGREGH